MEQHDNHQGHGSVSGSPRHSAGGGGTQVAIIGASGYTGVELVRLLAEHPKVHIAYLAGESQVGKRMAQVYPHLAPLDLPPITSVLDIDWSRVDMVFGCLPHGTSQEIIATIPPHVRVVDLSADFRLRDVATYAQWYGQHQAPALQKEAVYGLTEWARDALQQARLVANPGCYPTASQLPLIPLLKEQLVEPDSIVIDAKSGVTGAGRATKQNLLFTEIDGGLSAYGVGKHRHTPEIEQGLSDVAGQPVEVSFTPHLVPMKRGILATIYAELTDNVAIEDIHQVLCKPYENEMFITVMPVGSQLSTNMVLGSNHCLMSCHADRRQGRVIMTSVIDNLVKGASGQAIQNMNVMLGLPESTGLPKAAVFP